VGTDTHTCQGSGTESLKLLPDNLSLMHGAYRLKYTYQPKNGVESDYSPTLRVVIDRIKPKNLTTIDLQDDSDTGRSNSDNITSKKQPIFDVICEKDAVVQLWANYLRPNTFPGKITKEHICTSDGTVGFSFEKDFESKLYRVTYIVTDVAGNSALAPDSIDVKIDLASRFPHIESPSEEAVVTGTAEVEANMKVISGESSCTTTADDEGNYSCTLTPAPTENGVRIEVVATDIAGNISDISIGRTGGFSDDDGGDKPPCGCPDFADCMAN
jgi:hypothetical protein